MREFQLAVADSGFIDSYKEAVIELTRFLRSENGAAFAQNVGAVFKGLTDIFIVLLDNINAITAALQVFAAIFVYQRFSSGIEALGAISKGFFGLEAVIGRFPKLLFALRAAFGGVFAFIIGFKIGEYFYKEFQIVRDAGTYVVTSLFKAWAVIKSSYEAAIEALPIFTREVFDKIVSVIKSAVRGMVGIFADLAQAVGLDGIANALRGVEQRINTSFAGFGKASASIQSFRERLKKELVEIDRIREEMLIDNGAGPASAKRPGASPTPVPGNGGRPPKPAPSEAEIAKREREVEAIRTALENLDARIDRAQTETLQTQLSAIDKQYADLARRIERLGGKEAGAFATKLAELTGELRSVTIKKFNDKLEAEQKALSDRLLSLEERNNKKAELDLKRRLQGVSADYVKLYGEIEQAAAKLTANQRSTEELDLLKERAKASEQEALQQERKKFFTEGLQRQEQNLNDVIAARDKLLQAVNVQKEVGAINDVQAAERLNAIQAEYVPKINAAAEATRLWAEQNSFIFDNPEQQQVFLATLEAIRLKATEVGVEFSTLQSAIIQGGVQAVDQGLNLMADALTNIATGAMTAKEGFKGLIAGFAQFAAAFLRDIALMIIKMQIFNALSGLGGSWGTIGRMGLRAIGVMHEGGVVGQTRNRTRTVSPAWFANAPRYHSGGLPGLASSEYPTILKKGEEVLSENDPRNVMNGGMAPASGGGAPGNLRVVLVDDRAKVPEAMNSPEGERVMLDFIRRNSPTIKQALG